MDVSIMKMIADIMAILTIWFLGAIITIGIVQTVKNLIPESIKLPGWIFALLMIVVSVGVGFSRGYHAAATVYMLGGPIWEGLGISAISQICYESIYKGLVNRGKRFELTDTAIEDIAKKAATIVTDGGLN